MRVAEECVTAVKSALQNATTGIAAKLTAINTEKGDALTPAAPAAWYTSRAQAEEIAQTPAVFILSPDGATELQYVGGQRYEIKRQIIVAAALENINPETLQTQVHRYNRAIIESLLASSTGSGSFKAAGYNVVGFQDGESPLGGGGSSPFFQNGAVNFIIDSVEGV